MRSTSENIVLMLYMHIEWANALELSVGVVVCAVYVYVLHARAHVDTFCG